MRAAVFWLAPKLQPRARMNRLHALFFVALAACGGTTTQTDDLTQSAPKENWKRDILKTELEVDVAKKSAVARITVAPGTRTGASFEIGDLTIDSVESDSGPIPFKVVGHRLDVALAAKKPVPIVVHYRFKEHPKLEGANKDGLTFTWPTFCGNLFPCKSAPSDGLSFELALSGVPSGKTAVFPKTIEADAPSYMLAWAIGDFTKQELGTTAAGTHVSVWYGPGEKAVATAGTKDLVGYFDFYERTYGGYLFGDDVGSVSAKWGAGAFGGMEHHPYWHVSSDSMNDPETHAHEAAHGWFGDGVRLRCWEDLTLSEGTVSYLAARAVEAVSGKGAGDAVWASYEDRLTQVIASEDRVALPTGCDQIDVLHDLWNDVVYMKGAFFYRDVEAQVGRAALDRAIARFYEEHRGEAAGMDEMLDTIQAETGFDPGALADGWLRSKGRP